MAISINGNNNGIAVDGDFSVNHIDFIPGQGLKSASGFQQKEETVYTECKEESGCKTYSGCKESFKSKEDSEILEEEEDCAQSLSQLTNRQIVIMMSGILDISLSKDFTNQKQLAIFLSRLTGRSMQSIRQVIMNLANNGSETDQAHKDYRIAADTLEPINKKIASRLRNDAEE